MGYWSCIPSSPVKISLLWLVQFRCTCCSKCKHQSEFLQQKEETSFEFVLENASNFMAHENDLGLWVCACVVFLFLHTHTHTHTRTRTRTRKKKAARKSLYVVYKFIIKDSTLIMIIQGEFIAMQNLGSRIFWKSDKKEHKTSGKRE